MIINSCVRYHTSASNDIRRTYKLTTFNTVCFIVVLSLSA